MSSRNGRSTVMVTGASAGVGRAVAHEFARHGWNVGLIARGEAGLRGTIRDVERAGGRALAFAAVSAGLYAWTCKAAKAG